MKGLKEGGLGFLGVEVFAALDLDLFAPVVELVFEGEMAGGEGTGCAGRGDEGFGLGVDALFAGTHAVIIMRY